MCDERSHGSPVTRYRARHHVHSDLGVLGGMLAYRYGVRVAAETDQADGYRAGHSHDGATGAVR